GGEAGRAVYGLWRQHLYRLLTRYRQGGLESIDPRSRRPASNPRAISGFGPTVLRECGQQDAAGFLLVGERRGSSSLGNEQECRSHEHDGGGEAMDSQGD